MWRWCWWWRWCDDQVKPNPSEERPLAALLGALHPLLLHHTPPPPDAAGGQLAPRSFENKQLQQYWESGQTKGSSKTEALCPPASVQGAAKRVRGGFREEHTEQHQHTEQQDTEAKQLCGNQEVGLHLLS